MSKVCHECGINVTNPYYSASVIVTDRARGRFVISNLDAVLCNPDYGRVPQSYKHPSLEQINSRVSFAVNLIGGEESMWGTVSRCGPRTTVGGYEFVEEEGFQLYLPKSHQLLIDRHREEWVEFKRDGTLGSELVGRPDNGIKVSELVHIK